MLLKEIKTTHFESGKKYTFVLPMGSTEQHGPFLPCGTDTYCQDAILAKVVRECPEAVFLPTLEITCSKEHQGFPGTVWIEPATLMLVLRDICDSLKEYADNIVFVTGHGGNISTIDRFVSEQGAYYSGIALHHVDDSPEEVVAQIEAMIGGPIDDHAGNTEISMMLAEHEALVTVPPPDYPKKPTTVDWEAGFALKKATVDGIVDNHPRWVVSREIGERVTELSAEHLGKEIRRIMGTHL